MAVTVIEYLAALDFPGNAHQFAQPNFCGKCLYEDKWVDAVWTHKFGDKLTSKLGFRGFGAYFLAPAVRDDWIFTYYASLGYEINKHLGLSVSYLYDDAQSMIPDRPGIEYNRHLVQFGLKAKF